jgi:hydroxyethylthiazole kinase
MDDLPGRIADRLEALRARPPLVHNLTNYVAMNFTANALLALGASPVMAHAPEEVEEMAGLAGALVLNLGTLSTPWIESMFRAANAAEARGIPVILDPVGAGATRFRTDTAQRMVSALRLTVVRGNASEILAVAGQPSRARGVDATDDAESARAAARELARQHGLVVALTGAEDFVTDGPRAATIANGHPLMARITGTGCVATALTGAFCAVEPEAFFAAGAALVVWGIAGELAAQAHDAPGSFAVALLDALFRMDRATLRERARITLLAG